MGATFVGLDKVNRTFSDTNSYGMNLSDAMTEFVPLATGYSHRLVSVFPVSVRIVLPEVDTLPLDTGDVPITTVLVGASPARITWI